MKYLLPKGKYSLFSFSDSWSGLGLRGLDFLHPLKLLQLYFDCSLIDSSGNKIKKFLIILNVHILRTQNISLQLTFNFPEKLTELPLFGFCELPKKDQRWVNKGVFIRRKAEPRSEKATVLICLYRYYLSQKQNCIM